MNEGEDSIYKLIDVARWAPSGDNTQPWRFERISPTHFVIHGRDTRDHCVYDLDGRPSQLSLGALIESLHLAATGLGLSLDIRRRIDAPEPTPTFDVELASASAVMPHRLLTQIPKRAVDRRPYANFRLPEEHKCEVEASAGPGYRIVWYESLRERIQWAAYLWRNAGLRLRLPEAYATHRSIIEWNADSSVDRIPDRALGANALSLRSMRWALQSWKRVHFLNTWLGGTIAPRLELDLVPGYAAALTC